MLDFPSTPSVGDTLTGPSGQEWEWDGVKWIAVGGGGGGGGSQMGVTDGSVAAPGMIGEILTGSNIVGMANVTNNAENLLVTIPLTAGDWDVIAECSLSAQWSAAPSISFAHRVSSALTNMTTYVSTVDSFHALSLSGVQLASGGSSGMLRATNVTANTNVNYSMRVNLPASWTFIQLTGRYKARRMR